MMISCCLPLSGPNRFSARFYGRCHGDRNFMRRGLQQCQMALRLYFSKGRPQRFASMVNRWIMICWYNMLIWYDIIWYNMLRFYHHVFGWSITSSTCLSSIWAIVKNELSWPLESFVPVEFWLSLPAAKLSIPRKKIEDTSHLLVVCPKNVLPRIPLCDQSKNI